MFQVKQILMMGVAVLALGLTAGSASAEDTETIPTHTVGTDADSSLSGTDNNTVVDSTGAVTTTDANVTTNENATGVTASTKSEVKTKTPVAKVTSKHKVHAKPVKVLNSAPGDFKTSDDDSGMSGDVQAHDKVLEETK